VKQLKAAGYLVLKIITCNLNGWPDITALKDGEAVFIEVKRKGGKTRPLQDYRLRELSKQGFKVFVYDGEYTEY